LRAYDDDLLTPEVSEELSLAQGVGPVVRGIVRQMGEDGWLGIGWPVEYGGQGRTAIEQIIFFDESGIIERTLGEVRAWAQRTRLADGRRVIDQEWVQLNLARVHAKLEVLKLINWKVAWAATEDRLDVADASTIKVYGTEFYLEAFRLLLEVVGQRGYLTPTSVDSVVDGRLERLYRSMLILTFGGGTNEIQRELISMFGLGLPRSLR
jgi:alkylation response protein AidB-like acyl-CoA dehydrogenase